MVEISDFMAVEKIPFPPKGSPLTPPHQLAHTFKFKNYAPKVFRRLRQLFGIDSASYMLSGSSAMNRCFDDLKNSLWKLQLP